MHRKNRRQNGGVLRLRKLRRVVEDTANKVWAGKTARPTDFEIEVADTVFDGKKPKALIVRSHHENGKMTFLAYYPPLGEARKFVRGLLNTRPGNFAENFPGCVGLLHLYWAPREIEVTFMQASFSQKKTPNLSRSLVTRHGGWREHLLRHLFARELEGRTRVILDTPPQVNNKNVLIFETIGKEFGFHRVSSPTENSVMLAVQKD